jgi:hypothetical protein
MYQQHCKKEFKSVSEANRNQSKKASGHPPRSAIKPKATNCGAVLNALYSNMGRECEIYRIILEERSVFWEVIVLVIVRKKVHTNMCLIING